MQAVFNVCEMKTFIICALFSSEMDSGNSHAAITMRNAAIATLTTTTMIAARRVIASLKPYAVSRSSQAILRSGLPRTALTPWNEQKQSSVSFVCDGTCRPMESTMTQLPPTFWTVQPWGWHTAFATTGGVSELQVTVPVEEGVSYFSTRVCACFEVANMSPRQAAMTTKHTRSTKSFLFRRVFQGASWFCQKMFDGSGARLTWIGTPWNRRQDLWYWRKIQKRAKRYWNSSPTTSSEALNVTKALRTSSSLTLSTSSMLWESLSIFSWSFADRSASCL
mmetsp:Transcript_109704/g.341921  ORF Transcript_109704/g.341921 Transcript_109704/m.341921 type:complete len:279 (-) Transcript_109704:404-1240(-)